MDLMNDYCLTRDDWEAILDMTRVKVRERRMSLSPVPH